MRVNYHIIFQHLNLLSPRLRQFHRRKMPFLYSLVPLQLHLKALLEDIGPSAFVIEMIAMLFLDTVMEERRRDSSSNSDKGAQSKSNYDQKWEDYEKLQCVPTTIRENWGISVSLLNIQHQREQNPTLTLPLEGSCQMPWTQISPSMKITWAGTSIMTWLHIHIMWGRSVIRWIKNGLNIYGALRVFFIFDYVPKPPIFF